MMKLHFPTFSLGYTPIMLFCINEEEGFKGTDVPPSRFCSIILNAIFQKSK